MQKSKNIIYILFICLITACTTSKSRERINFTNDWKFQLGDNSAARYANFNDSEWRSLNLPHDWSIEGEFSEDHPTKPEGGALPAGVAWYRKSFVLGRADKKRTIFINFDGIYRMSEVWINGHYLGKRPNGYISFRYDLTPYLKFNNRSNVIAVRVDNSAQPNSRWYTGSGIYRNVWLEKTSNIHIAHWGAFVTTQKVSGSLAKVNLEINLNSTTSKQSKLSIETEVFDEDGVLLLKQNTNNIVITDSFAKINQQFDLNRPKLWSVNSPHLYLAFIKVLHKGKLIDTYKVPFGIRTFEFHPQKGFYLNGEALKIQGVCMHHDLGALGAAVNTRAIERQLEILKEMGCNAIRTAHNPPAPELLDLCDRMGFLVMDEAFDVWKKRKVKYDAHIFWDEWHERDLADMVRRDRNHPSVIVWSIGNEIREQFDSTGLTITPELVEIVKKWDTTRPVLCALTENIPEKNYIYQSGALELLGFNYKHEAYRHFPDWYPGEAVLATETSSALASRGQYNMPSDSLQHWPEGHKIPLKNPNPDHTVSAYDHISAYWGSTHEETWKEVKRLDHMAGLFIWTGFDYLGEPIPYPWPARSSYFGVVDLAGFPKDSYYMYQSEWTDKPMLHVFPHWNWTPGQTIDVWAYYNQADEVELFINDESKGVRKKEGDDLHVMWRLEYEPGTLKAVSRKNGETVIEKIIQTAENAAQIALETDRKSINSDGRDLAFITVTVRDEMGNLVPNADHLIHFKVDGPASIVGVDNGYQASLESFKADFRKAFHGKCLLIVQAGRKQGSIEIEAISDGLTSSKITIHAD